MKFRAYDGNYLNYNVAVGNGIAIDIGTGKTLDPHCLIMESTGFYDKNVREIYVGDVLEQEVFQFGVKKLAREIVKDRAHYFDDMGSYFGWCVDSYSESEVVGFSKNYKTHDSDYHLLNTEGASLTLTFIAQ